MKPGATKYGPPLIQAMFAAPLVGVAADGKVLHALDMKAVVRLYDDGEATAPCGAGGLKLLPATQAGTSAPLLAEWPPRVAGMPDGWTRCRECQKATGSKRPRCEVAS